MSSIGELAEIEHDQDVGEREEMLQMIQQWFEDRGWATLLGGTGTLLVGGWIVNEILKRVRFVAPVVDQEERVAVELADQKENPAGAKENMSNGTGEPNEENDGEESVLPVSSSDQPQEENLSELDDDKGPGKNRAEKTKRRSSRLWPPQELRHSGVLLHHRGGDPQNVNCIYFKTGILNIRKLTIAQRLT